MKKWSGVIFLLSMFLSAACSPNTESTAPRIAPGATATRAATASTVIARLESSPPAPMATRDASRVAANTALPVPTRAASSTVVPTPAQTVAKPGVTETAIPTVPPIHPTNTWTPTTIPPTQLHGDSANGERVFQKLGCKGCHMPPSSAKRRIAPELTHIVIDAEQFIRSPEYHGGATDVASYIRESILDPDAFVVPAYRYLSRDGSSIMPKDFAQRLQSAEVDDLVVYILTLPAP